MAVAARRDGRDLAAGLRAFSRARRSAAACLRLAARLAAAAFRLRRFSAVACLRLRALKSDFGAHVWLMPRTLPHVVQVTVRRGRSLVRVLRGRRVARVTQVWVMPRDFPQVPHFSSPPPSFTPMGSRPPVLAAHAARCAAPQVSGTPGRGTGRGTPGDVPRLITFPQVSVCRANAARVPRHHGRAAAARSDFLHPLRLVPVRPGGQRTSPLGTPRARAAALTDSAVASACRIGK